jgi:hypothetical protein
MEDLERLQAEYEVALNDYIQIEKKVLLLKAFIRTNDRIDSLDNPFSSNPTRGGAYGDYFEHPAFGEKRWDQLMTIRDQVITDYPGAYPLRYIDLISKNIIPPGRSVQENYYSNVLVFGICDSINFEADGYICHLADPYTETTLFVSDVFDKDYIMSLPGKVLVINIHIDDDYKRAYSSSVGYTADVPIELEVVDIAIFGDKVTFEGTAFEDLDNNGINDTENNDFGF